MSFEIWLKGRETPIGKGEHFQAIAEETAKTLHAQTGREAYVTDNFGAVVYRIKASPHRSKQGGDPLGKAGERTPGL